MFDVRWIRDNPQAFDAGLARRGLAPMSAEIGALDDVDNVVVSLRFPNGLLASIDVSRQGPHGYDQRLEVLGSAGMLRVANPTDTTLEVRAERLRNMPRSRPERDVYGQLWCKRAHRTNRSMNILNREPGQIR